MGTAGLNHAYRFVWSDSRQGFVAVAELPRSSAKGTGKAEAIVVAVLGVAGAMGLSGMAHAADLPTGGQVVAGSGSITHSGKTLTVTQTSGKLAADWQSFNIGAGHTVNFVQPSASAVALNRVLGSNVSVIQGALNANGHVFLVNPNGVLFSPTAQVNVGALTASTLNLSNDDFMAGNYRFSGSSTAGVRNEGSITAAHGGTVALIAARIENIGQITADQGQVLLGAGNTVRLDLGGPVKLEVQESALNALIEQGGGIRADGGLVVYLTAKAAGELASSVINHSGITEARTLASGAQGEIILSSGYSVINTGKLDASAGAGTAGGQITVNARNIIEAGQYDASGGAQGGRITLAASHHIEQTVASTLAANAASGPAGSIRIEAGNDAYLSGTASANGTGAGAKGGEIALTAPKLVVAGASLSATGEAGGGRIRVGGGWQGGDADLANAQSTYVVASTLDVSATVLGAGGTAVLWSEAATTFGGGIKAMGGTVAGDGGQVEISSRDQLTFGGTVDAKAFNGQNGRLLLDPKNIDIVESVSGVSVLSLRDPTPGANEEFGGGGAVRVVELMNGDTAMDRIAVASPLDSTVAHQAGAVHLYNSQTGALLSTLTGSQAGDKVGTRVTALANGHYVVSSSDWANGAELKAGAATWGNGATGLSGTVSAANSLVGSKANDQVGKDVTALTNGHYVVSSIDWANGAASQAGAATWGNGSTGVKGAVSVANSLVGSKAGDKVGNLVLALTNGHYVVGSSDWGNGAASRAGAATWGSGTAGVTGVVSSANSLVGTQTNDRVGERLIALTNGNYVVSSLYWANGSLLQAGAVTWGNGTTGVKG
ncbi:MAG: filamentous hemagglutinin N-terminal domain-containing protein, partial [Devosia sp.]